MSTPFPTNQVPQKQPSRLTGTLMILGGVLIIVAIIVIAITTGVIWYGLGFLSIGLWVAGFKQLSAKKAPASTPVQYLPQQGYAPYPQDPAQAYQPQGYAPQAQPYVGQPQGYAPQPQGYPQNPAQSYTPQYGQAPFAPSTPVDPAAASYPPYNGSMQQ